MKDPLTGQPDLRRAPDQHVIREFERWRKRFNILMAVQFGSMILIFILSFICFRDWLALVVVAITWLPIAFSCILLTFRGTKCPACARPLWEDFMDPPSFCCSCGWKLPKQVLPYFKYAQCGIRFRSFWDWRFCAVCGAQLRHISDKE